MNNMMTGQGTPNTAPQQQMGGYGRSMNPRMGMGLGGFGSMRGGYGGGDGMSFNAGGFGGFGGFNPIMGGFGGFGGFNPMMGGFGGFGGYGGFNPMMGGFGGFNPMMGMGLGAFGGGFGGFNPMMGGYGQFGGFDSGYGGMGGFNPQAQAQQRAYQQYQQRDPNQPPPQEPLPSGFVSRDPLEKPRFGGFMTPEPQAGLGEIMYKNPQDFQRAQNEILLRQRIDRQINDQFTRNKNAGMSLMDNAKAQDELSNRLYSQYGLKPPELTPN